MSGYVIEIFWEKNVQLFANSGDPDQTLHSVASDLGLHCLSITLLGVSSGLEVMYANQLVEMIFFFRTPFSFEILLVF